MNNSFNNPNQNMNTAMNNRNNGNYRNNNNCNNMNTNNRNCNNNSACNNNSTRNNYSNFNGYRNNNYSNRNNNCYSNNNCYNDNTLRNQSTSDTDRSDDLGSQNISPKTSEQTQSNAEKLKNIKGISPEKLNLISDIIKQSETVSSENLIPFFLNAASTANAKGINFSDEETDLIITCLKTNMSQEQINKLETVRKLANIISASKTN